MPDDYHVYFTSHIVKVKLAGTVEQMYRRAVFTSHIVKVKLLKPVNL